MKYYNIFSNLLVAGLLFIINVFSKSVSYDGYDYQVETNKDQYYLIYVNNTYGEINIFSNSYVQKRQESQLFIESLLDEINALIINNKDTYEHPEKLDEIVEISQLRKRKRSVSDNFFTNFGNSEFVYPISSINGVVVLNAYLSSGIAEKIKTMENIKDCIPNSTFSMESYYNVEEILAQTHWKNVTIRGNADLHLSLISQGKYNSMLYENYDDNYYYPSSAGKDIDIIILDSSFHFNYTEFANTNERIIKCAAIMDHGKPTSSENDYDCGTSFSLHGERVSDMAGGLVHGSASRANIYGISLPNGVEPEVSDANILGALQLVYEKMIRPHKTVINMSLGKYETTDSSYYIHVKNLIDAITAKGGIVVAAAGNDSRNIDEYSKLIIPCTFENVLCVGGIKNYEKVSLDDIYEVDTGSNYGNYVDVYAPFHAKAEYIKNGQVIEEVIAGTSYASPLIAGMIATIMSENTEIEYTKETMTDFLVRNGEPIRKRYEGYAVCVNNGKRIVYSKKEENVNPSGPTTPIKPNTPKCGPRYGACPRSLYCCGKDGYCGITPEFCGKGCQNKFGYCD